MKSARVSLLLIALALVSFGTVSCTMMREAESASTEQTLAAAGFRAVPANTAKRAQMLASLPAYKVVPRESGNRIGYVYADPGDDLLYIGGPAQYQRFQQLNINQEVAEDYEVGAAENDMISDDVWDWNEFGPGFW